MADSFVALEKLFTHIVMGAVPDGTSTRSYSDDGNLCIDIGLQPDGNFSRHTIRICILKEAVYTYARRHDTHRREAEARLTRYVVEQFRAFFAARNLRRHYAHHLTEWTVTEENLNG